MDVSAVVLPDRAPTDFVADVRAVEAAGLRGAWTYDHLSWRDLRDGPWHAAVPLLAAAATATTMIRLGFLVASPNFRHPVPFAKDVMTLDHVSGGRFDLGIGAGGTGADATVLGNRAPQPSERADRFEAFVRMTDELLRNEATTATFGDYAADDARMLPGCVQRPRVPITLGAAGPRALRFAAQLGDGWVTYGPVKPATGEAWYAAVAAQVTTLDTACDERGRDRRSLRRTVLVGLDDRWQFDDPEFGERVANLGFDEVAAHWPRPDGRGAPRDTVGMGWP